MYGWNLNKIELLNFVIEYSSRVYDYYNNKYEGK